MIEVFANGKKFKYWTSASVRRSLGNIAAYFSLSVMGCGEYEEALDLWPGDSIDISVDGTKIFSGYIRKVSPSFSDASHSISVTGYEKTCDLVDCSVTAREWANKDFSNVMNDICSPFGIVFKNKLAVDVGKTFEKFSAEPGAKAIETIQKLCKERGVLPASDGLGGLFVFKPDSSVRGSDLKEGENVLSASADYSDECRFSDYSVYGTGKPKSKIVAERKDSEVTRYRPLVIVDSNAVKKESVDLRADWEYSTRKAKAMVVKVSVSSWKNFEPGQKCSVLLPHLYISEPLNLLVSSVEYSFSSSGERANLTLVQPDSFEPQPEKTKKAAAPKAAKNDVWGTIKKAVKG